MKKHHDGAQIIDLGAPPSYDDLKETSAPPGPDAVSRSFTQSILNPAIGETFGAARTALKFEISGHNSEPETVKIYCELPCTVSHLQQVALKAFGRLDGGRKGASDPSSYPLVYNGRVLGPAVGDTNIADILGFAPVCRLRIVYLPQSAAPTVEQNLKVGMEQARSVVNFAMEAVASSLTHMFGAGYSDFIDRHWKTMGMVVFLLLGIFFLLFGLAIDGVIVTSWLVVFSPTLAIEPVHWFVVYAVLRYTYAAKKYDANTSAYMLGVLSVSTIGVFPILLALKLDRILEDNWYVVLFPFFTCLAYMLVVVWMYWETGLGAKLVVVVFAIAPPTAALCMTGAALSGDPSVLYEMPLVAWGVSIVVVTLVSLVALYDRITCYCRCSVVNASVSVVVTLAMAAAGSAVIAYLRYLAAVYGQPVPSGVTMMSPLMGVCGVVFLTLLVLKVVGGYSARRRKVLDGDRDHRDGDDVESQKPSPIPQQLPQDISDSHYRTEDGFYGYG